MEFNREKFRLVRKKKKIALKKLTSQIGKSYRTLLAWEKGERNPGESDIRILAQLLDISVSEISDLEDLSVPKNIPYYHQSLGALEQLNREFSGDLSIEKQTYLLNLKNELEHLSSEIKMLKKVNIQQRLIIDSLYTFIYTKDTKLKYTDANASFLSYLNIPVEELIGKNNHDLFALKDFEELSLIEKEVLQKGVRVVNRTIPIPGSNGKKQGVLSVYPVYNDNEEVTRIIGSLTDVSAFSTEQKRRKMMEFTINQLNDAVWIILDKPVPHFIFLSKAISKIYGRPLDDFYCDHKLWLDLVHPDDRKRILNTVNDRENFPRRTQYRIIRSDGAIHWVESRAYKKIDNEYNDIIFGTLRDITKEKEAEAEKNLLHSVIDKFEEIVWIGSKNKQDKGDFRLHYINSKACNDMIGFSDSDLVNDPDIWINRVHPDDRERVLNEFDTDEFPRESKYRIIHRDNTVKYLEDREYRINDDLYFGFVKDISEDKHNSELLKYFKTSVNQLNGVFWIKQILPKEQIIFMGNAIENIIGYSAREVTTELWYHHILEEDRVRVEKAYRNVSEKKIPLVYKIRHKNGSIHTIDEVWFEVLEMKSKTIKFGFIRDNS